MIEEQAPNQPVKETSKPHWTIWLAAGGCAVLLCSAIFLGAVSIFGVDLVRQFIPSNHKTAEVQRAITFNNTMGDPNAPVHIIE